MKTQIYDLIVIPALVIVTLSVKAEGLGTGQASPPTRKTYPNGIVYSAFSGRGPLTAQDIRLNELDKQIAAIYHKADLAHVKELVGDRNELERLFLQKIAVFPESLDREQLAKLYEREKRQEDAFQQWKILFTPNPRVSCNLQSDPVTLVHFGDLALNLGEDKEAVAAYRKCVRSEEIQELDLPEAISSDYEVLREAAYYSAALENISGGSIYEALNDLKICMPAFSHSTVVHSLYGHWLFQVGEVKAAKKQMKLAEEYCNDILKKQDIHKERIRLGLIKTNSIMIIDHGRMTQSVKEIP